MAAVTIYYSSVAGSLPSKKKTDSIKQLVVAHKIAHTMVDLSLQENTEQKEYMKANSASTILPQVFVNGKFKGLWEDLEAANEDGQLVSFLS